MSKQEQPASADLVNSALETMTGWAFADGTIAKTYETDGWRVSMLVANAIAFICEAADHHADVLITWPRVRVTLSTHSAGGVTEKDLEVARLVDAQLTWRPPTGSNLAGPKKPLVR